MRAREIGFVRLGVCGTDLPPQSAHYASWIRRGLHGRMSWLERSADKRLDPGKVLEGARSILVGGVRYAPQPRPPAGPWSGEVSCYAWGDDYHLVVGEMASALAAFMDGEFGCRSLGYVDTGPVLERMWAAQAGVGWIGKNSLVLDKGEGSYLFLAAILTTLDLPPDEPAVDQCGACTLCIESCPTGAIVEPRVVDSRLCLSYHTIELRGAFPDEHREALGGRLFGCDDCQEVCPWNQERKAVPEAFEPRPGNASPDLREMVRMELPEYTRRFRASAMKRATYQGLRRNAAIALGNRLKSLRSGAATPVSDPDRADALRALQEAAGDENPSVARAARASLSDLDE